MRGHLSGLRINHFGLLLRDQSLILFRLFCIFWRYLTLVEFFFPNLHSIFLENVSFEDG